MTKENTIQKEEQKNPNNTNKQKGFFNPNVKGGKNNGFLNQRNTFTKQIRNNHRPQG